MPPFATDAHSSHNRVCGGIRQHARVLGCAQPKSYLWKSITAGNDKGNDVAPATDCAGRKRTTTHARCSSLLPCTAAVLMVWVPCSVAVGVGTTICVHCYVWDVLPGRVVGAGVVGGGGGGTIDNI